MKQCYRATCDDINHVTDDNIRFLTKVDTVLENCQDSLGWYLEAIGTLKYI